MIRVAPNPRTIIALLSADIIVICTDSYSGQSLLLACVAVCAICIPSSKNRRDHKKLTFGQGINHKHDVHLGIGHLSLVRIRHDAAPSYRSWSGIQSHHAVPNGLWRPRHACGCLPRRCASACVARDTETRPENHSPADGMPPGAIA